jgi:hypothetical protein
MRKFIFFTVIVSFVLTAQMFSLPRFALRSGQKCIDCHINPTGGEMRSDGGWLYGRNTLSMYTSDGKLSPKIGDNISFGFDYRTQYLTKSTDSTMQSDFMKMEGTIYINVEMSDKIDVYARYDFLNSIWEAYGLLNVLPNDGYIKVGTFSPNYGIRLDDHTAYTRGGDLGILFATGSRQGLIYGPFYTETGIEAGVNIGKFINITASAGNPRLQEFVADPTYTTRLEITPVIANKVSLLFGSSYAIYKEQRFDPISLKSGISNIQFYGGFAGIGFGNATLMAEYDIGKNNITNGSSTSSLMIEGSYRLIKGLEAVVRYDRFDKDIDTPNNELQRLIAGFEFYPYSFIEVIPQYRFQWETPEVKNNSLVVQFHLYY